MESFWFHQSRIRSVATAAEGRVYWRASILVKRVDRITARGLCCVAIAVWGLLCASGCASPFQSATPNYVIAVRYGVESALAGLESDRRFDHLRRDFTRAAELGFDTVAFSHLENADRTEFATVAGQCGLAVILPDRDVDWYILTGRLPRDCESVDDLTREASRCMAAPHGVIGLGLGPFPATPAAHDRALIVMRAAGQWGVPCFWVSPDSEVETETPLVTVVDSAELAHDPESSPLERMLARFHEGLEAGRTGGLLVDQFARAPGDLPGVNVVDEERAEAKLAALRGLIQRARQWGPRLHGLGRMPLNGAQAETEGALLTAFVGDRRRYVMARNASTDRYLRGEVVIPATIDGIAIGRLVEIPASTEAAAGRVFFAQRSVTIVLPLNLRPGDAALFEAF